MKEFFEAPEITVLKFALEDVVTLSEFPTEEETEEGATDGDVRLPGVEFGS